ncbi:Cytochrome c-type biogenesis protein CcmF [Burkholderiales bacterium]|nr:Cytochrome c-type biogenesis protein CcmF [Burkholderiales bacterium]
MIPELGQFALVLALLVATAQGVVPLVGAARRDAALMSFARPAAITQFALVAIAFGCLATSFLRSDFSVLNVAQNSFSALPAQYKLAASWGSHEGSLLLWALMLAGWSAAVALRSRNLPAPMLARVLAVMGLVAIGFLSFLLFTSNPFERLVPPAPEGRDLNPLLQDPGMVMHPPLLYMGYVGFAVAFAFSIAALIGGRLDATWARWSRPWTTVAWCFLTVGIALGSWWAYYELGWGGWWFWDPVENASFMPWLVGTALIHSLAVTEKRGTFRSWTVLLAIMAFSLSLLGTFLVRSGVLTSVHAFATDPARGVYVLAFLVIVIGGSLALYAARAGAVGGGASFAPVSRESMLLANNILLVVAMASVLLGTLYPLFLDALNAGKISVGPPYFESVFGPLMAPLVFLMGIGPISSWRRAEVADLWTRLKWALVLAILLSVALPFAMGRWSPWVAVGMFLATWVVGATVTAVVQRLRGSPQPTLAGKLRANPSSWYGMLLAHVGIAVFIVGVTLVKGYEVERDVRLDPGQGVDVGGWTFTFKGIDERPGPNYRALVGTVEVRRDGTLREVLRPEKRVYTASGQSMTEAAISPRITGDLYVSLGEPVTADGHAGAWGVRIYVKPFIDWIWGGCVLMALGGFLAIADRRYRIAVKQRAGAVFAAARA